MSGLFSRPRKQRLPPEPEPIEDIEVVEEEAEVAKRKERKRLLRGGGRSTILSGISTSLKKRLGA